MTIIKLEKNYSIPFFITAPPYPSIISEYIELTQPFNKEVRVKLLPLGTTDALPNKTHLQKTFDLLYLGASQVGYLKPNM